MGKQPGTPEHAAMLQKIRQQKPVAPVAPVASPRPPVTTLTDETGRPIGGAPGPRNPAQTGVEAPVAPKEAAVTDAAKRQGVRVSPPKPTPPTTGASIDEIIALRTEHGAEEAGTKLANDPRFRGLSKTERTNAIRDIAGDQAGLLPAAAQKEIDKKIAKLVNDLGISTASKAEAKNYLAKAPNATAYNYVKHALINAGFPPLE